MQAVGQRGLLTQRDLDVLQVFLEVGGCRHLERQVLSFDIGEQLLFLEDLRSHNVLQVGPGEPSVPIIDDMSTVHNLTEDIDKILKWNLAGSLVGLHIPVEDQIRIPQISHVEGITHIPALGSESLPLNNGRMEEAQSEVDRLNFGLFLFDLFFGEVGEGTLHVGLES